MCRGINTETVKLGHLKADGDCILFDFKVTKKNQEGTWIVVVAICTTIYTNSITVPRR